MPDIQLTPEQQAIISAPTGHYVITAVAGSGKTTTLSYRIRHLLEQGIDHRRLLVLMFNKAAQRDFTHKLDTVIGNNHPKPEVRTFHAMGYRLYQRFIQQGILPSFNRNILSEKEAHFQIWRLMNQHLEPEKLKEIKRDKKEHVSQCLSFIENVKSTLQSPDMLFAASGYDEKFAYCVELFDHFEQWRRDHQRISYSDMLYDPVRTLIAKPELVPLVANKMDVILVDEYQDTNDIQHALLKLIAGERAKVTIVGDPDQTIYEFRGAKPDYMLRGFSREFDDTQHLELSYSFRYGHQIALLANHLICHNKNRRDILCKAHHGNPKTEIQCHHQPNQLVKQLAKQGLPSLSESAILVRVWSQTASIELSLLAHDIPYRIEGSFGVFQSDEMHCVSTLLAIASGEFANLSPEDRQIQLERLFRFPHIGLPDGQVKQMAYFLSQHTQRWGQILLAHPPADIKKFQALKIERLAQALNFVEGSKRSISDLLTRYAEQSDLYEGIKSLSFSHDLAAERVATIQSIFRFVGHLKGSASEVLAQLNALRQRADAPKGQGILLSTIHRAKGLEWQHIYLPDLYEGIYPYIHHNGSGAGSLELESERRLLYVAMTRAIRSLHLFMPKNNDGQRKQSRFETEMNVPASAALGALLSNTIENSGTLTLEGSISPGMKKYANTLNLSLISSAQNQDSDSNTRPVWFANQVEHYVLGPGEIVDEQSTSFTVRFEDNNERVFSKQTAERFFKELETA